MTADRLWQYALTAYGRPGVRRSCLALQDEAGVNVCLVLTAAWLASLGRCCDDETLDRLLDVAESWESVLRPLRQARRALRSRSEMLYARARQLELAVERQLLAALAQRISESQLPAMAPSRALADNLQRLAAHCESTPDQEELWQQLVQALA